MSKPGCWIQNYGSRAEEYKEAPKDNTQERNIDMKTESRVYYHMTRTGVGKLDKEASIPVHEAPDDACEWFMNMCESIGYKRHENATQIWFDKRIDSHTVREEIFYK